jgi:hypothetical protein
VPKVKLIGGFAKHCIDHEKQRAELRKFVETMVEGLKQQEDEEEDIESRYKFRVRKFSLIHTYQTPLPYAGNQSAWKSHKKAGVSRSMYNINKK